ncbi:EF-hand domain-containing protein [Psidium guajava]|nr:EF-hand domain-containing protein [Psidium guajava]
MRVTRRSTASPHRRDGSPGARVRAQPYADGADGRPPMAGVPVAFPRQLSQDWRGRIRDGSRLQGLRLRVGESRV